MIPADVKAYLGDFPENDDLLDMLNPVHRPEINRLNHYNTHRGNLALSSCPGKKVRLSGPVKGRASISRDLDLDLDRMKSLGIAMIVW
jgi:hypothetical protein